MKFRLLGPVEVEVAGETLPLPRRKDRCLLAVLLLEANRMVSHHLLARLMWDGDPPDRARRAIHGQVSRLRTLLAKAGDQGVVLATVGDGYRMEVDPQSVDVHLFRRLLDAAAGTRNLADRIDGIRAALDLWRGPVLDNAATPWLRDRLCADLVEQRLAAVEDLLTASLTLRREREVLPEIARTAAAHPGREHLVMLHMRALYQANRKTEALEVYERARVYLADELGLDPGHKVRELHQAILRDQVDTPAPPVGAIDTGAQAAVAWAGRPVVPRQMPAAVAGFTGRKAHLDRLDALLPAAGGSRDPVVVTVIGGTAGVGKTALAIHWGRRMASHFPDGQLYVNLRGFDPNGTPVAPAAAVRGFLDALQVPPQRIPLDPDARVGLYCSLLADRRMLVVLDNARDAAQVRPLLPGAPGCLVLVTSRHQLSGLVATEGAIPLALDPLPDDEARQLLVTRLGRERVTAEPEVVEDIVAACAGLPLALAVTAARATARPGFPLVALAAEIRDAGAGLEPWTGPDTATNLRAVFSWSYHALDPAAARLFRLLGLHPSPDIAVPAAASLAGAPLAPVRRLLAELADAHLLVEHTPGRYTFHDLLRAYASELAHTVDSDPDREAAWHRMLDHYLHTAHNARHLLDPHRRKPSPTLSPPQPGVVTADLPDHDQAAAWLATEHRALMNIVEESASNGFHIYTWRLAACLGIFFWRYGHGHDHLVTQHAALQAALHLSDRSAEARAHAGIGNAHFALRNYHQAREHLQRARDLLAELDEQQEQAYVHLNLASLAEKQRHYRHAVHSAQRAHELFHSVGDLAGQSRALNMLGWSCAMPGSYREALSHTEKALAIQQEVGDPLGAAPTWDSLGYIHHHLGDHEQAIACYQQALELYAHHEIRYGHAETLAHLGDAHHAAGRPDTARTAWQAALGRFETLAHPDAEGVRTKLNRLGST